MDPEELKAFIEAYAKASEKAVADVVAEVKALVGRVDEIEKRGNRPLLPTMPSIGSDGPAARMDAEERKSFGAFLRKGILDGARAGAAEFKGMSTDSDPEGGYLTQPTVAREIFRVMREASPIRQIARVIPIDGTEYVEPQDRAASIGATWVGERQARVATSTPQLGELKIPASEIYAQPEVTSKNLEDSVFDVEGYVTDKIGEEFGISEGAAFVAGNGVDKPRGFTTYQTAATVDASRAWGTFEHIATGAAGAFAAANPSDTLVDTTLALKSGYLAKAVWVMNRLTLAVCKKIKDGQGNYMWVRGTDRATAGELAGYPVVLAPDMPNIAANSLSIAFGDFSKGYTIVQKKLLAMLRDPYTNKPYVRFYTASRIGGDVSDFHAIKFVKFAAA